jgi:Protein of unknown function (DUF3455)
MNARLQFFASATLLVAAASVFSFSILARQDGQEIPQALQSPVDEQLLLELHGKGDQIYTCKSESAQFNWTLKAPDAQLFDQKEQLFGKHFAGPSWQANDGSRVTGKAAVSIASPDAESIPWLLVKVVSREGNGMLSRVTTIQRLHTKGGKAPASGCDSDHVNQEVRVPYSADYFFYSRK